MVIADHLHIFSNLFKFLLVSFKLNILLQRSIRMDGSTGFTCVTCRVVFETAELQRDHYKTEWHRYNLKRQAAELPAIGIELFNEKAASFNPTKVGEKFSNVRLILTHYQFFSQSLLLQLNHCTARLVGNQSNRRMQ